MTETFRILPCGDRALSVELSRDLSDEVNRCVIALDINLTATPPEGLIETVQTYRSILVLYDPLRTTAAVLSEDIAARLVALPRDTRMQTGRILHMPVHYGGEGALDLNLLAEMKGLTTKEVIRLHGSVDYRIHMIGFAPGFAYLGGLPEILHTPRREVPRQFVPAGAIGIGGRQASVNSVAGPSGWRFIGSTPIRTFDPTRAKPFLLQAGDLLRFHAVTQSEAARITAAQERGEQVVAEVGSAN